MAFTFFLAAVLASVVLGQTAVVTTYSTSAEPGDSNVQYTLGSSGFDAPKIDFFNATSAQWWYFDVVSTDLKQSVVISFLGNAPGASDVPAGTIPFNFIEVNIQLPNGNLVALSAAAEDITITTVGNSASGVMNGAGYSWYQAPDLANILLNFNDTVNGLSGSIQFNSDAPPHAPCGPPITGASLEIVPHLGWGNSMPDSLASVNLNYNDQPITYQGRGYHDTNWGNRAFGASINSWYWGHARLGPYSVVWFDVVDINGVEHQTGYVASNGTAIADSCGATPVRPTGANSAYPPIPGLLPTGFHIVYDMGSAGVMELNVTNYQAVVNYPGLHTRWVGSVVGGIQGQTTYTGVGLYEEMA
ncbi:hypothetical protein DACRYDRAFT_53127 [Dacryopinax primogenitus]|uniref:Hydroxyneurosporene synthase n=1 Tax=Dacryopinax primogenitus (strain DJM 731) TaxID=1858805 RepID=M5FXZ6_DACPD|nr:uncharacterized protein DACRYDRAFT_53127 [Dacryopinax primogenitus]EJU01399.1 hypothetical protein DACRYDRAFT_53127 [Dacryopinax primogenitus]